MTDSMGTFRTRVELENPLAPGERQVVPSALVDTGAALSWFPGDVLRALHVRPLKLWRFRQADGTVVARWTAEVRVFAGGTSTIDEVVIGEPGDLVLLGARSLEGLNLRVDPVSMRLVDAGPAPAAAARSLLYDVMYSPCPPNSLPR
jgi:predicted aspartyl protease